MLVDLVQKQQQEQKRTLEFLKYSLGNRPPADYAAPGSTGALNSGQTSMIVSNT